MKTNRLLSYIVIFCLSLILVGCGNDEQEIISENVQEPETKESVSFVEGKHAREDGYEAAFNTYCANAGGVEFHVINNLYEETSAKKFMETVTGDYQVLKAAGSDLCGTVKVYVVQVTIAGKPQVAGNSVFCTMADIESGAYRECLVAACYQNASYWKSVGLSGYLFDDTTGSDFEELKAFYETPENVSILSMFPVFFSETFSDEDTLKVTKSTAAALTKYMVGKLGFEEFLKTEELVKYSKEWCESLGLDVSAMVLPENDLSLIKYGSSDKYPVVLEYDNITFYLKPVDWITTAQEAYIAFEYMLRDYQMFWKELEQNNPQVYAMIKDDKNVPIWVYIKNADGVSYTDSDKQIYLDNMHAWIHEMVHIVLYPEDHNWYYEGLTEFLTQEKYGALRYATKDAWQVLTNPESFGFQPEEEKFYEYVASYYTQYKPLPKSVEELDFLSFVLAVGKTVFSYPDLETSLLMANVSVSENIYHAATEGKGYRDGLVSGVGNSLTYPEATVVIEYLADKYGMETVIAVAQDITLFEKTFGDVATVIEEVKNSIEPVEYVTE